MKPRKTLEGFFWAHVQKGAGCWIWTGHRDGGGYGLFQLSRDGKRWLAHRASWTIHNGLIPTGLLVCHHCDNPPCVNPAHLFLGSHADNLRDASRKGRLNVPGKGWHRELTHCKRGHPYDAANTYNWARRPMRVCRKCHAIAERKRRASENR